jgi:predicted nucleic acid-binding protein
VALESLFIDTGAVGLLVNPRDSRIARFWQKYKDAGLNHCISEIVYWEYLRQFRPVGHAEGRKRFRKLIKKGHLKFLPFDREAAQIGVKIYHGVQRTLPDDEKGKHRLKEMHCDIMIAATAVHRHKTVVMADIKDWAIIRGVVDSDRLGTLPLIDKKDM